MPAKQTPSTSGGCMHALGSVPFFLNLGRTGHTVDGFVVCPLLEIPKAGRRRAHPELRLLALPSKGCIVYPYGLPRTKAFSCTTTVVVASTAPYSKKSTVQRITAPFTSIKSKNTHRTAPHRAFFKTSKRHRGSVLHRTK